MERIGRSEERPAEYLAIGLVSAAVLLFETLITRVLSVTLHYHWLWAVNGAASVLASVAAIALSIVFGLTVAMVLGALGYLAIVLLWTRSSPRPVVVAS